MVRYAWLALAVFILISFVKAFTPSSGADGSEMPQGPATAYVTGSPTAARYRSPAVTTADYNTAYWVHELTEGFRNPRPKAAPARLAASPLSPGCGLYAPSADALVYYVELDGGDEELPLYFIGRDDVKDFARYMQKKGRRPDVGRAMWTGQSALVDVFVTETSRPVYLVLGAYAETLWSLQLAKGVKLDGVAVIGYEGQALAHAPPGTRVRFVVYDNSPQRDCIVTPTRAVPDSANVPSEENTRRGDYRHTKLNERELKHRKYRKWLRQKVGPPDTVISASRTSHILIGPKPAKRLAYCHLTGADILYTPNINPVWGTRSKTRKAIYEMVDKAVADGAAGQ